MSWLDKLQTAATLREEPATPAASEAPRAPAEINHVTVSVRNSNPITGDPGEAAVGYFTFEDGKVTMVSEEGAPLGAAIPVKPDVDPRAIARAETAKRWNQSAKFWGRRLEYPRIGSVV